MDTPEFLIWAIECRCPIRGYQDGSDPEHTERQLRAARAYSDAQREGRVFEGLCVDPPRAFRIEDALTIYGGPPAIEAACRDCPVNALANLNSTALAGCYGLVPLPEDPRPFHQAVERGIELANSKQALETRPRWYGMWLDSPLSADLLLATYQVLEASPMGEFDCRSAIAKLLAGLNAALKAGGRLHVRLYPRGRVEGPAWKLAPHCPRCKAEWLQRDVTQCQVCGRIGHPAPDEKRQAQGRRPYFPLDRLLGAGQAAEFLVRYEAFRARQPPPGPAESPLPPAPPGSLPAG